MITPNSKYISRLFAAYVVSNIFFVSFDMKSGIPLAIGENLFVIKEFKLSEVLQTIILENGKNLRWSSGNQTIKIDSTPNNDVTTAGYFCFIIPIRF